MNYSLRKIILAIAFCLVLSVGLLTSLGSLQNASHLELKDEAVTDYEFLIDYKLVDYSSEYPRIYTVYVKECESEKQIALADRYIDTPTIEKPGKLHYQMKEPGHYGIAYIGSPLYLHLYEIDMQNGVDKASQKLKSEMSLFDRGGSIDCNVRSQVDLGRILRKAIPYKSNDMPFPSHHGIRILSFEREMSRWVVRAKLQRNLIWQVEIYLNDHESEWRVADNWKIGVEDIKGFPECLQNKLKEFEKQGILDHYDPELTFDE